jgi:dienelactone hydrolase
MHLSSNFTNYKNNKMKTTIKLLSFLFISSVISFVSCSKSDDSPAPPNTSNIAVVSKTTALVGFSYKTFYQEVANATNRKGIVIIAHGDGGNSDDGTINDQCNELAQNGYVAVTTSYRAPSAAVYATNVNNFKADMESVINKVTVDYNIPINKTIIGGLSRGGDLTFPMFLPANADNSITPTTLNVKGVILQCSGGDEYKGRVFKKQVAFMANKNDNVFNTDATTFQTGLSNNSNNTVKTLSECLIIQSTGHCTDVDKYKPFVLKKVKEWLP